MRMTPAGSGEDRRAPSAGLNRIRFQGFLSILADTPGGHRDYTSLSATTRDHLQFPYGYCNAAQLGAGVAGDNGS